MTEDKNVIRKTRSQQTKLNPQIPFAGALKKRLELLS